jgi:hypothetical protein
MLSIGSTGSSGEPHYNSLAVNNPHLGSWDEHHKGKPSALGIRQRAQPIMGSAMQTIADIWA